MDKITGKTLSVLVFLLAFYSIFAAGIAMQAHHWSDLGYFGLLAAFWTFLGFNSLRLDREADRAKKEWLEVKEQADAAFNTFIKDMSEHLDSLKEEVKTEEVIFPPAEVKSTGKVTRIPVRDDNEDAVAKQAKNRARGIKAAATRKRNQLAAKRANKLKK